jgi:hypothetical protein
MTTHTNILNRVLAYIVPYQYGDTAAARSISCAVALIESVQEMGWHPIETAPKESRAILVWTPRYQNIYAVNWDALSKWWVIWGGGLRGLNDEPTHWMPLPQPPEPKP